MVREVALLVLTISVSIGYFVTDSMYVFILWRMLLLSGIYQISSGKNVSFFYEILLN